MEYMVEQSLKDFEFWSGAKNTAEKLNDEQFALVEQILEHEQKMRIEGGGEPITETEINDLFWFEPETVFKWAQIYPKFYSFTSKIGRESFVELNSQDGEDSFLQMAGAYGISDTKELDCEPLDTVYKWDKLFPNDTFWEEANGDFIDKFEVRACIPAAYENNDWTGISDKDDEEFRKFVTEYSEYFDETEYAHIWDNDIHFGSPDYGDGPKGDVVTLRIYAK